MKITEKSKTNAILFDTTRCIGCRNCEDACDTENAARKRKWTKAEYGDFRPPPEGLSAEKWLQMNYHPLKLAEGTKPKPFDWNDAPELAEEGQFAFNRRACMHCVQPSCETACIVGALRRQETGAVTYDKDKCIGCRYCMIACPFNVPKWEWHNPLPYIKKCTMCHPRQLEGKEPACVEGCPGNYDGPALIFGQRHTLLYEGEKRIHESDDRYYPHVFGRDEIGGTGVLYLIQKDLVPKILGFPESMITRSLPDYAHDPMSTVPYWVGGLGAMFWGLFHVIKRRDQVMAEEGKNGKGGAK
jgi:formate dehydrogenase iron-sulfur subunit